MFDQNVKVLNIINKKKLICCVTFFLLKKMIQQIWMISQHEVILENFQTVPAVILLFNRNKYKFSAL